MDSLECFRGHDDDKRRKKKRKELLKVQRYEEKEFVPRDLTQTSQLVRMGAQLVRKVFQACREEPIIVSMPGSVTGAVRKSWNVLGCLTLACPQVKDETGAMRTKTEIRDITHLHHALDACVLGLASHFIPNNGRVWGLIVKRKLTEGEKEELLKLGVFDFDSEGRFQMRDLSDELKRQVRERLAEKRVVQHVPSRMYGLRVEQNTWRVVAVKDGEATLEQRIRQPDGSRSRKPPVPEKLIKLLGLEPGKLNSLKGVLVIPDNYGVAILDDAKEERDKLVIIPWHMVHARIFKGMNGEKCLIDRNLGKLPRVLRNGQIVRIAGGTYKGIWKITSIKNQKTGIKVNLGQPDTVNTEEEVIDRDTGKKKRKVRASCRHEASLASILKAGISFSKTPLTGIAARLPATSS